MDIHEMKLNPEPFDMIVDGTKTVEYRLWDEKRRLVKQGDTIIFTNTETGERIKVNVKAINVADSFADLKKKLVDKGIIQEGEFAPEDMYEYYSAVNESKYGVVGIEIKYEGTYNFCM